MREADRDCVVYLLITYLRCLKRSSSEIYCSGVFGKSHNMPSASRDFNHVTCRPVRCMPWGEGLPKQSWSCNTPLRACPPSCMHSIWKAYTISGTQCFVKYPLMLKMVCSYMKYMAAENRVLWRVPVFQLGSQEGVMRLLSPNLVGTADYRSKAVLMANCMSKTLMESMVGSAGKSD